MAVRQPEFLLSAWDVQLSGPVSYDRCSFVTEAQLNGRSRYNQTSPKWYMDTLYSSGRRLDITGKNRRTIWRHQGSKRRLCFCYDRNTGHNWLDQTLGQLKRLSITVIGRDGYTPSVTGAVRMGERTGGRALVRINATQSCVALPLPKFLPYTALALHTCASSLRLVFLQQMQWQLRKHSQQSSRWVRGAMLFFLDCGLHSQRCNVHPSRLQMLSPGGLKREIHGECRHAICACCIQCRLYLPLHRRLVGLRCR